ncbi:MAG TPA: hypothetical protein VH640_24405 [Bryobacteraceae bacterium]
MSKNTLRLSAVVLTVLIVIVAFNAFDHLPGNVRAQIDSQRASLAAAQKQFAAAQQNVAREEQANASLFRDLAPAQQVPGRFSQVSTTLQSVSQQMDDLTRFEKEGHYNDRQRAETLISSERNLLQTAQSQLTAIQSDVSGWISRAQNLPAEAQQMEQSYHAVQAFNLAPLKTDVARAQADWPEKKSDLEARLASVTGIVSQADSTWQSTAAQRAQAAKPPADFDTGAFLTAADQLKSDAASLPTKAAELKTLTGQLYNSWDKLLVDMETRGHGGDRTYQQKIRTVSTRLADATAKNGSVSSDDQWVMVSQTTYNAMRNNLGMAVEHKSAGKYDFEADHIPQPAGFAYMAPPSQGSNQYGYWDHRDGQSFWVWYGQYALLRDLLFNHSYRPLPRGDWDDYRYYRNRGETYYGRDYESGGTKYGTNGATTQDRYAGSNYGRSGGFRESPYASRPGGYRNSPYSSPSARNPGEESSPRVFGQNHSAPRPSFRPPSGAGRRFGGRRR